MSNCFRCLFIAVIFPFFANGQNLDVEGNAKIAQMDKVNSADSVVVRLPNGILGVRDVSTLGELQVLTISNDTIFLSNGSFVKLPADQVDDADNDPSNEIETWSTLSGKPTGFADDTDDVNDADADPMNEIQNLSDVLDTGNDAGNTTIANLKNPVNSQDAATKSYVDELRALIDFLIYKSKIGIPDTPIQDIDGNVYNTVKIGDQIWTVENLRTTKYNDGTPIPFVMDGTAWASLSSPGYCFYDTSGTNYMTYSQDTFGALCNDYVVADTNSLNVCPVGWHVPTDSEWSTLQNYLGGESYAGGRMKEPGSSHWNSNNIVIMPVSDFSGLPGGQRTSFGSFSELGQFGYWWSSTEYDAPYAWYLQLYWYNNLAYRTKYNKGSGYAVRCLRD